MRIVRKGGHWKFCPDKKIGLVISSDHDPNALLRNTVEMKRRQLAKLDGFYSKEREDLLAEEKLLDMKIKKMENKINIHTLNLNPPNSQAIFGGYQDGKEVWVTHK